MSSTVLLRNNVIQFGRGNQPMLFAHGFGCDQNMWRLLTSELEKDYRIVLFDYVGSGKSDLNAYSVQRYSRLNGYVEDVLEICDALDLRDIIFVGHSVSSMVGLLASIRSADRFSRLVLIAPSPCYINDLPDYRGGFERSDIQELLDIMGKNDLGWASFLAPVVMKNQERPELSHELEASFCAMDPAIARRFAEVTFLSDSRSDLPKVTVPSLILQCSDDAIAPIEVGHYLHRQLAGSTLKVMKVPGHCPHMSHPEESIHVIREYLETAYATAGG